MEDQPRGGDLGDLVELVSEEGEAVGCGDGGGEGDGVDEIAASLFESDVRVWP